MEKIEKELTTEEYIDYICGRFDEFVRTNKRYIFGDGLKMILTKIVTYDREHRSV